MTHGVCDRLDFDLGTTLSVRPVSDELMTISAFAHATALSPRALRSYDRLGLLRPTNVDPESRYRRYGPDQVRRGQAIRMLRELELPLLEIRELLDCGSEEQRDRLLRHQRRLALRSVEIKHALGRLQSLIEGGDGVMDDVTVDPVDEATHRRLAGDLFNRSWQLLELENRTPAQDDKLVHVVHAAAFHWGEVGNAGAPCTGREPVRARVFGTRPPRSCAPSCAASARVGARRRRRLRGLGPGHRARSRCTRPPGRREPLRSGPLRCARPVGARQSRRPGGPRDHWEPANRAEPLNRPRRPEGATAS